jgi:hypothetical protein
MKPALTAAVTYRPAWSTGLWRLNPDAPVGGFTRPVLRQLSRDRCPIEPAQRRKQVQLTKGQHMSSNTVFPLFAFERDHHTELETGSVLAGTLIVDIPKGKKPKKRDMRMLDELVLWLADYAKSGRMPKDAQVIGWHTQDKPPNAVDTDNEELMSAWADRSFVIAVRGADDTKQMDSIMRRESGSGFLDS